ncbi:MAG: aminoacyl-tRNA hydrolase [Prevotellaceae bacterium]|nr:aminoacyl-tRNA hydrolase [Candidatus Faecinaster equi]
MVYLITGLGNIGDEYDGTRHNIGFRIADELARRHEVIFSDKRYGFITEFSIKGQKIILLKPSTYMNASGNAVRYWVNQKKIDLERLLIVNDDIALPLGTIRMKPSGSEGGHNGLRSITSTLGTNQYARLRFGVGNEFARGSQIDWVLGKFDSTEEEYINTRVKIACDQIESFCLEGIQNAMNKYNSTGEKK